jgi:hypothetical protein
MTFIYRILRYKDKKLNDRMNRLERFFRAGLFIAVILRIDFREE